MKVYLDNCMFNRPFDDQSQIRIRLETEAKLYIQDKIKENKLELIWSYILELENQHNPHDERRNTIIKWKNLSVVDVEESPKLLNYALIISKFGVKAKDSLHIAAAIVAKADYFLTTDDKLLSAVKKNNIIYAANPIEFLKVLENGNSNH